MATFPLCVTWGKEKIELSIDPSIGVKGLKSELQEKSNVPVARQKILAKSKGLWKGVLKDDADLATIDWSSAISKANPLQLLLMGSAEEISSPKVKTVFLEDLPEELKAKVAEPAGLVNLGNTCYMNSVVQALRGVPELRTGLLQYRPSALASPGSMFVHALSQTLIMLDSQSTAVQPMQLVGAVKLAFPQFAQRTPDGRPMQQDAEEFYSGCLNQLAQEAKEASIMKAALPNVSDFGTIQNMADALFGMELKETFTCDEEPNEPVKQSSAWHRKLVCNISAEANHIAEGLALGMRGKIEKHSDILQRNAMWTREDRIHKLPLILVVQFGRFYWKTTPDSQDHTGVKCKIMKPMTFNDTLDVYDFCTPEIQAVLKESRAKALKAEEEAISKKLKGEDMEDDKPAAEEEKQDMEVDRGEDDEEALQAALAMSLESNTLGPGIPATFQGHYELFAVVTHKGRDADGGHYMSFVKSNSQGNGQKIADTDMVNEDWFVFDDDSVSPCKTEDVLKLKGGGDWHMSYLNFYRVKK